MPHCVFRSRDVAIFKLDSVIARFKIVDDNEGLCISQESMEEQYHYCAMECKHQNLR